MSRTILPLVVGALLGGATVYVSSRLGAGSGSQPEVSDPAPASSAQLTTTSLGASDGSFAPFADAGTTGRADAFARDAVLDRAAADPDAVLVELSALSPPARQRDVALAVLAALGGDDASLSRVAAMLPAADRLSFRIDALARRAESDPFSALTGALALDVDAARRLAIPRIAAVVAGLDPSRALALASRIGDRDLRSLYLASAAGAWGEADPSGALAFLESAVPHELTAQSAAAALDAIAASDHDVLLRRLNGMSPALQPVARRAAILALAERDLPAALAEVDSLAPGRDAVDLEAAVAERYALVDPAAAVEWARTRAEPSSALEGALRGAAAFDYDAAVDLALQVLETEAIWPALALVESGAVDAGQFADRLLESAVPDLDAKFRALMIRWPQIDAEAALEWARANAGRLERGWLERLALDGGREYPELAIALLDSVPPELRGDWLARVAGGIAASDTDRALAFLEPHRGEPGYDEGLARVVDSLTASDPVAAARLVERTGARAAGRVAWAWAQADPVAASTWVAGLEDPEMRRDGVANLAANWSRVEPDAAVGWLLGLSDDSARDIGLQVVLPTVAAATGSLDVRALGAISDDRLRERAASTAIVALGRSDPDEARRLVDEHIDDPRVRQDTLRRLAEQGGGMDSLTIFSSSIDVPQ